MKVVYDLVAAQPEGNSPTSGGGEYARRVFLALLRAKRDASVQLSAVRLDDRPLDPTILEAADRAGVAVANACSPGEVVDHLYSIQADRFFSALPLRYVGVGRRLPSDCHFIFTIHGLRPIELPWDRYELQYARSPRAVARHLIPRLTGRRYVALRGRQFGKLFALADRYDVVSASFHTRAVLLAQYPSLAADHVTVLYSPREHEAEAKDETEALVTDLGARPGEYVLVLGANRWGKNAFRALRALAKLHRSGRFERQIVAVGGRTMPYLKRARAVFGKKLVVLDYVPRTTLLALYRHAWALLFPSLNEGFGYPPLEAMERGTPVIASTAASLPEVTGGAALLADPRSEHDIATRVLQLATQPGLREQLVERGLEQARSTATLQDRMLGELVTRIVDDRTGRA